MRLQYQRAPSSINNITARGRLHVPHTVEEVIPDGWDPSRGFNHGVFHVALTGSVKTDLAIESMRCHMVIGTMQVTRV